MNAKTNWITLLSSF